MVSSVVGRDQIIALSMVKWFRILVEDYEGGDLKGYLMKFLDEKSVRADVILAEVAKEIFGV